MLTITVEPPRNHPAPPAIMRLKRLENQWRCYLNPTDYKRLRASVESRRAHIAVRLGGECGLRVGETAAAKPGDIRESTADIDGSFIRVVGKDTTGKLEEGKWRDAFLPENLRWEIEKHADENDIGPDDELIPVTKRTTQKYIKRAAEFAADRYGNSDYERISSHDLRAYFATHHLIRLEIPPEVIMAVGGWKSYGNMEPYLSAQFDDVIVDGFKGAGIA